MFAPFIHQSRDFRTVGAVSTSGDVPVRHVSLLSQTARPSCREEMVSLLCAMDRLFGHSCVDPTVFHRCTETPRVGVLTVFDEPLSVPSVASASTMRYFHMWSNSVASLVGTLLRYLTRP